MSQDCLKIPPLLDENVLKATNTLAYSFIEEEIKFYGVEARF
jgi:hypothetical protein